jgi:hypothetical protein
LIHRIKSGQIFYLWHDSPSLKEPTKLQTRGERAGRGSTNKMKLTRVQQAIKILNASAEASSAELKTATKTQPKKKPMAKSQSKKRDARK